MRNSGKLDLLIVDDEKDTRLLLAQIFEARGHSIRIAGDGFEALRHIRESVPDALLSDLNMPGMSGFELLSVVRRLYPQIHVIATSGAYSGFTIPTGIAADGFHAKATGLGRLFGLVSIAEEVDQSSSLAARTSTPLWVGLERRRSHDPQHVLINCPCCLRPFREEVEEINAEIRRASCVYCQASVSYALALGVRPAEAACSAMPELTLSN